MIDKLMSITIATLITIIFLIVLSSAKTLKVKRANPLSCKTYGLSVESSSYDVKTRVLRLECG